MMAYLNLVYLIVLISLGSTTLYTANTTTTTTIDKAKEFFPQTFLFDYDLELEYGKLLQELPSDRRVMPIFKFDSVNYTKYYNASESGPREGCVVKKSKSKPYITFENGQFTKRADLGKLKIDCTYACKFYLNNTVVVDTLRPILNNTRPECDVLQSQCTDRKKTVIFNDVYFQIFKKPSNEPIKIKNPQIENLKSGYTIEANGTKYNVHLMLIDTVGEFTFERTLPKTNDLLKSLYEAFAFKLHHKNGEHTLTNVVPMLMNGRMDTVIDAVKNRPTLYPEMTEDSLCRTNKQTMPFIPRYYQQLGYTTLRTEDFWYSHFSYPPICAREDYYDHDLYPFMGPVRKSPTIRKVWRDKCLESYKVILDYFEEYLEKYNGLKQFSYNWMTKIQHDSINGLYHADSTIASFFEKNVHHLENSFVFFLSDHGTRFGDYRENTDIGEFEDKNPFLRIMVPKNLRQDVKFMEQMTENSKLFTSHNDIFASLLDVITEGRKDNFKDLRNVNFSNVMNFPVKGQSLLRKMIVKDEYEMEIPLIYQFYQGEKVLLKEDYKNIKKIILQNLITLMNQQLLEANLTSKCTEMFLNGTATHTIKVTNVSNKPYFIVNYSTVPGTGKYIALVNERLEPVLSSVRRLNTYQFEAETCETESSVRQFCYCRMLLP